MNKNNFVMDDVIRTNDDAAECRWSAIKAGLLDDSIGELNILEELLNRPPRSKQPIINRGTFIRTKWIDTQLETLLFKDEMEVVILGAGFDLRAMRLQLKNVTEVDLDAVIDTKKRVLPSYPADLIGGDLSHESFLKRIVKNSSVRKCIILAECLFPYLERKCIERIIKRYKENRTEIHVLLFEPIVARNVDPFGSLMLQNVPARMPGVFVSASESESFYISLGFKAISKVNMNEAITDLSKEDQERLRLRGCLDEYEEWSLMSSHYYLFHYYFSVEQRQ